MPRPHRLALALLALALPPAAGAQPVAPERLALGAGGGVTQSDRISGAGWHVQAAVPTVALGGGHRLVLDALYQWGAVSAGPNACEQTSTWTCFGRTDRNRIAGLSLSLRPTMRAGAGAPRLYLVGGVGVYRRWTRSREAVQPPGGLLTFPQTTEARTAPGGSLGGGLDARVGPLRAFAEVRAHRMLEGRGSRAGALPVTLGLRF